MSQNCSNNSGRKRVPELYGRTILVRTGIAQFWYVLELLHAMNNSGTYQNCTILVRTRIEVAKYNMTKIFLIGIPKYVSFRKLKVFTQM